MLRAVLVLLCLGWPVSAQTAADQARAAADELARAAAALDHARGARDRVAALTAVITAYERGLASLRDGLRQVAIRERALAADLGARETEIARLVAVLSSMERAPAPLLLLHPSGPLGTARSSMMLSGIAPALQARADALRSDLETLRELRMLERSAAADLEAGLAGVQDARVALSEAIAERDDLPPRLAGDEERIDALLARVDTLAAFADGLGTLSQSADAPLDLPFPRPAEGVALRRAGEADAAGIARPGIVLATAPAALVTAPVTGTVRYAGPLLDYGNVIILEPRPELLLVFAGLAEVYARHAEIVDRGAPLGLMGGGPPRRDDFRRDAVRDGGASRPETLYIEVRQGGRPVNPAEYFATE
ncbi:peptidoglycan DD-metalloendopeptidase family protein [Jannaschia sp. S6380]|uniref:murein hydrolase activator EnvC family protein n=1 Tax=Jannaschia sp. S6380 TaxID=2926408 RepID=UPI001FF1B4BB|nr:peptidoglycan DD-metalloendopeptidase family protein [Jannaschia sp. S6380]MCK0168654.1 peptidoglycan DD-metalloendopeptidase family protein [Jannaschia sp. S6380]